jgi:mono/diheme cytochrome c family protein
MRSRRHAHRGIVVALGFVACLAVAVTAFSQAAGAPKAGAAEQRTGKTEALPGKTVKVTVPVEPARWGDSPDMRGARHFVRYCAACHRGLFTKSEQRPSYGPTLGGVLKDGSPSRETAIRGFIQQGSLNMPGFRNTLAPNELDDLIAYLKTL